MRVRFSGSAGRAPFGVEKLPHIGPQRLVSEAGDGPEGLNSAVELIFGVGIGIHKELSPSAHHGQPPTTTAQGGMAHLDPGTLGGSKQFFEGGSVHLPVFYAAVRGKVKLRARSGAWRAEKGLWRAPARGGARGIGFEYARMATIGVAAGGAEASSGQTSRSAVGSHGQCRSAGGRLSDTLARGAVRANGIALYLPTSISSVLSSAFSSGTSCWSLAMPIRRSGCMMAAKRLL